MIAGDAMAKRVITLICLILLLAALCACSKRVENLDEFEKLVISAASETQKADPFASEVYVIIPKGCSAELAVRAEALVLGINEKTGIKTYLKYDDESVAVGKNALEILLGNTSRDISKDALRTKRADDYLCMYDRGALVIAGKTDEATIAALDRFEKDILSTASNASIMHEAAHFEYCAEYNVDTIKLNGYYLYDYAVKADGELNALAGALESVVLKKSGYLLDTKNPSSKSINIILDKNAQSGIATIETEDQNISIRANSTYGLSAAVVKFAQLLIPNNAEKVHDLNIDKKILVEYEKEGAELLIGVVEEGVQSSLDFHVALGKDLFGISTDLLLFLRMSDTVIDYLEYDLRDGYGVISKVKSDNESSVVICGKENISFDAENMCVGMTVRDDYSWNLVILDFYDSELLNDFDSENTMFLIRENDSFSPEYADLASLSFSFGGKDHNYRILTSQDLLELTVTEGECVEIDGSAKIFWKVSVASKYHASFKDLQNSLN